MNGTTVDLTPSDSQDLPKVWWLDHTVLPMACKWRMIGQAWQGGGWLGGSGVFIVDHVVGDVRLPESQNQVNQLRRTRTIKSDWDFPRGVISPMLNYEVIVSLSLPFQAQKTFM